MGKSRRMNYELIVSLYENNYGQVLIGKIFNTPHGHISKVLRKMEVQARERGTVVEPIPYSKLSKDVKQLILADKDIKEDYENVTGYKVETVKKKVTKKPAKKKKVTRAKLMDGWKEMSIEERGKYIVNELEKGKSTRQVASEIGIGQSTLVGTKNKYLYGTSTKPKTVTV